MNERVIKQLTIVLLFLVVVGGVVYGGYRLFRTSPTCFDQIKNQSEEGVDCGLVCSNACEPETVPLEVLSSQLVAVDGGFDFIARVKNPNVRHGGANVSYDVVVKDATGRQLSTIKGTFYILPVQTKYIIKSPLPIIGNPTTADLVIKDVTWHKVEASDLKIDFPLIREQHGAVSLPGVKYQVEGSLENRSDFDFDQVDVAVLLLDIGGMVQAVNTTTINTFLTKSQRYFKVSWPTAFPDSFTLQVQGGTNVFNNSNFLRRYGTQEEFQRYQ